MLLGSFAVGGIERMALSLARALGGRFCFSAVAFDSDGPLAGEFREAGATTALLRRRPGVDAAFVLRLGLGIRRWGADLVHCHNETALFYGRLAAMVAGVPVVYTEHDRRFPPRSRTARLNRALALSCRGVVTVSGRLRDELAHFEGIDANRIRVIRNGVEEPPAPDLAGRARIRAEIGVGVDEGLVLAAGRLSPEKGFDVLVRAAAILGSSHRPARFAIAGTGPEREALAGPAAAAGVRMLGLRRDVPDLFAAADLAVLPSRSEGLPLVALEAAAAGRALVATDVGAMREVVVPEETGVLVAPGSPEQLAEAVRRLLADPARREAMGRAARRRYVAEFSLTKMAQAYSEVYASALGVR
jgi:glycosyltransferase involved in cell wall biosynthesis